MRINFQGAIFDADGTLLDSMQMWRNIGRKYLGTLGINAGEELDAKLYIMSFEQGCEYIKTEYKLKLSAKEIRHGIINIIENFYVNEVELKPGVKIFLESLRQKNIPMVIATLGDKKLLQSALIRNGIEKYFDSVFASSELNTTKHEPKIYISCAEYLGLEPGKIAVFEDALYAIKTAKAAGFITFGVEDSSNMHETERIKANSDYYIKDFAEEAE